VAAHGVRGWVKVESYTDPPQALLQHRQWRLRRSDGTAEPYTVREVQWSGRTLRVALAGIGDRDGAEALRGCPILIERAALPAPGAHEYYRDDLLGFTVRNAEGVLLGTVQHFLNVPAGAVMVVRGEREYVLPAAPPHMRRVDLEGRAIEVDWPADF